MRVDDGARPEVTPGSPSLELAWAYVLVGLLAFLGLSVISLPVEIEDDRWLRVGSVMLAVGLALWLRPTWLLPSVVLLALAPASVRGLLGEDPALDWTVPASAAALVLLASGIRYLYVALTRRSLPQAELDVIAVAFEETAVAIEGEPSQAVAARRRLAGRLTLHHDDAAALLIRLKALDAEVMRTGHILHAINGSMHR
jgi:hypothetical protein